jgi:chromosome segregation ATPase
MVIMNLNMGNLNLEVSSLKNRLMIKEKEKVVLHVELDKERDFQKEYKNNIEIWRKNRTKNKQRVKALIQKLQDENKELKVKTTLMKS